MTFREFNLHEDLLNGVDAMNFKQATPIQEQAIPAILEGKDLIACAQTGTGKTAAYLLPLLDRLARSGHDHTSVLILVPTRELAKQIDEQVEGLSYFVNATSIAIYGGGKGSDWDQQKRGLNNGADIVIATPGRLIAQMQLGYNQFDKLDCLVLDEADKMLDMGFADDIMNIIRKLPVKRQTLLFSATMPNKIREFSKRILVEPHEIRLSVSKPAEGIDQQFYLAHDRQKLPILEHLLKQSNIQSMVMFTSRKSEVNNLVRSLRKLGYEAKGISSDLEQDEREVVLREFKMKQFPILVATDVLSRGIDIDNLSHVVNYDIPRDAEDYIHRIGRTARASTTGTAITFVSGDELYRVARIEKLLEREVEKRVITEELGLGPAPEATSRNAGRPERGGKPNGGGGRNNDRRRKNKHREGGRKPVAEGTAAVAAPIEVAAPVAAQGDNTEVKKNTRSRRRKPRPKQSGTEVAA